MKTLLTPFLADIAALFETRADFVAGSPYGNGHINDTFCAEYDQAGHRVRYIHQRINQRVFKDPGSLMDNIHRVTTHSLAMLNEAACPDSHRRTLTLIPAKNGLPYAVDAEGGFWRTYPFIERARTYDVIETVSQARAAAAAFGAFQKLAASLQGPRLIETIPNFHHTPKRLEALRQVAARDHLHRAAKVSEELDFVLAREDETAMVIGQIEAGHIPERITHNDTKLNNVMLDDVTQEGICVIDLDTVMPGSILYDFSDMVRTATSTALEDEPDLNKVHMQLPMFEALVTGYLSTAQEFLVDAEIDGLSSTAKLMPLECGIRFLTDYLDGDVYFKIKHPDHNLVRARNQFALVRSIEKQQEAMNAIVRQYRAESEL